MANQHGDDGKTTEYTATLKSQRKECEPIVLLSCSVGGGGWVGHCCYIHHLSHLCSHGTGGLGAHQPVSGHPSSGPTCRDKACEGEGER